MHAHFESEIRKSFINCSKGAAQRINIPHEVAQAAWDRLIFLSWIDPKSPRTGYVVAKTENGLRDSSWRRTSTRAKAAHACARSA